MAVHDMAFFNRVWWSEGLSNNVVICTNMKNPSRALRFLRQCIFLMEINLNSIIHYFHYSFILLTLIWLVLKECKKMLWFYFPGVFYISYEAPRSRSVVMNITSFKWFFWIETSELTTWVFWGHKHT